MAPDTRPIIKGGDAHLGQAFVWWLVVAAAGFSALLATLCASQFAFSSPAAGERSTSDLIASRTALVNDAEATSKAKQEARQQVMQVFKRDESIDNRILGRLNQELDQVRALQESAHLPMPASLGLTAEEQIYVIESSDSVWQRIQATIKARLSGLPAPAVGLTSGLESVRPHLERSIGSKLLQGWHSASRPHINRSKAYDLPSSIAQIEHARQIYRSAKISGHRDLLYLAVSVEAKSWPDMTAVLESATKKLLQLGPLFPDVPRSDWERTVLEFLPDRFDDKIRWTCTHIISSVLEPNVVVDTAATALKADQAAAAVKPILRQVHSGEVIVPRGTVITSEQAQLLSQLGISKSPDWPLIMSLTLSLMAACTFFGLFLHTYAPKHLYSTASIGLLFTLSIVVCGVSAFVGQTLPQFVPLPAAALISTVFFGPRVSMALLGVLLLFFHVDNLVSTNNLIALATASCVALGANLKQRHDLMFRGFLIGIMQAAGFACATAIGHANLPAAALGQQLLLQIFGGLSSCIVAIGSLPFLEDLFGMVTPFRIMELTGSDQPLLRRLEENAPGTYQHSLAVANLAEAGARAIGADVNLVRAGSLYHDIGKMVRPRYFIENQLGDANPHDSIPPEESRDRVLAHVTDGVALAQKYGLPRAVQDFIPQHQGTTLMAYFYHKACLRDGAENVDPSFYRYPGPSPQSREAAIVMLADVSEAVTHSLSDPTQEEVEATMSTVFKARWDDGQFTESGLTSDELERVKKAFVRVWRTLHHERLKYPSTTTGRMAVVPEPPEKKTTSSQPGQKGQE